MADVTINQLTRGIPTGNNILPYSTGSNTLGVPVSSLFADTTISLPKYSTDLFQFGGAPNFDGAVIRYESALFGGTLDGLVIEKTDGNGSYPDGGIMFANKGIDGVRVPALSIRGTGNVGIGTTDPSVKLDVNGTLKASEVIAVSGCKNSDVVELAWTSYSACNLVITAKARPTIGSPFKLEAMFSHYGYVGTYGSIYYAAFAWGGSPLSIKDTTPFLNTNNGTSGSWSVTYNGTDIVISKSAGSYDGQGYYWIKLTGLGITKS